MSVSHKVGCKKKTMSVTHKSKKKFFGKKKTS